jgi:hypothetical protein
LYLETIQYHEADFHLPQRATGATLQRSMNRRRTLGAMLLVNVGLLGWFASGLTTKTREPNVQAGDKVAMVSGAPATITTDSNAVGPAGASAAPTQSEKSERPTTVFTQVYSPDPREFAANLRAIGCPEDTIKDILTAAVHSQYQSQEQGLRPTPADHVPFSWSARTSEPRLIDRRQKAGELARDESSLLRNALSCEISVPLPLYATTLSDQQFEAAYAGSDNACALREVQDIYWTRVQALQQRVKGFWLPQDVAELEDLKVQRRQALSGLLPNQ